MVVTGQGTVGPAVAWDSARWPVGRLERLDELQERLCAE